jgi:hypothetical protein
VSVDAGRRLLVLIQNQIRRMLNSSVVVNMRDAHTFQGKFPDRSRRRQRRSVAGRTACSAVRSRGSVAASHSPDIGRWSLRAPII